MIEPTELLGEWRLRRTLVDEMASQSGTVDGELTLSADRDEISWAEHGTLTWNGRLIPVSRSYRFRCTDEQWWLHFSDGRPFHPWRPGEWVAHPCRNDTYRGLVTITSETDWQTEWVVQGPAKSLHLTTHLTLKI